MIRLFELMESVSDRSFFCNCHTVFKMKIDALIASTLICLGAALGQAAAAPDEWNTFTDNQAHDLPQDYFPPGSEHLYARHAFIHEVQTQEKRMGPGSPGWYSHSLAF